LIPMLHQNVELFDLISLINLNKSAQAKYILHEYPVRLDEP